MSDVVALKIDDTSVTLTQLLHRMRLSGALRETLEDTAREILLERAARAKELKATEEELGDALAEAYGGMDVEGEAEAKDALAEEGLSLNDLRASLETAVIVEKFTEQLTEGKVEPYFKEHWEDFETVEFSEIAVREESLANEILTQLRDEDASFEDLATKYSILEESGAEGGYAGEQTRADLPQELREPIFKAKPGEFLGPFELDGKFFILRVEYLSKAELDDETEEEIVERLVDGWVEGQLEKAKVSSDLLTL